MNAKNERIRKLWERGITDKRVIAKKLGYNGESIRNGIERVEEGLRSLGIIKSDVTRVTKQENGEK